MQQLIDMDVHYANLTYFLRAEDNIYARIGMIQTTAKLETRDRDAQWRIIGACVERGLLSMAMAAESFPAALRQIIEEQKSPALENR